MSRALGCKGLVFGLVPWRTTHPTLRNEQRRCLPGFAILLLRLLSSTDFDWLYQNQGKGDLKIVLNHVFYGSIQLIIYFPFPYKTSVFIFSTLLCLVLAGNWSIFPSAWHCSSSVSQASTHWRLVGDLSCHYAHVYGDDVISVHHLPPYVRGWGKGEKD